MTTPAPKPPSAFERALEGVRNIATAVSRKDSWVNAITGLGGARDKTRANAIARLSLLNDAQIDALYSGDDLAATIVDALPDAAFLKGFTIAEDDEGDIMRAVVERKVIERLTEAAVWGLAFGRGALLLGVDAGPMDTPLDVESVGEGGLQYLLALDKRDFDVLTTYDDPNEANYTEPEYYRLRTGTKGKEQIVHESRLILFGGVRTTTHQRRENGDCDHSVLQRPYEILKDANTNWASTVHLLSDASQAVMKIKGLIDIIADGDFQAMSNRMEAVNVSRSIAKAIVVDAESESFEQVGSANMAGVPGILQMTWQRLAAAARMPVTVLMGMSPAGMNATGESDIELWHARVSTYQTRVLTPALTRLVKILARSEGISTDGEPTIEWPPLLQESPSEEASTRKTIAETDAIYVAMGAVLPGEVTAARWGQGKYSPNMSHAIDLEAHEKALEDELADLLDPPPPPPVMPPPVPPAPGQDPNDPEEEDEDEDAPPAPGA